MILGMLRLKDVKRVNGRLELGSWMRGVLHLSGTEIGSHVEEVIGAVCQVPTS